MIGLLRTFRNISRTLSTQGVGVAVEVRNGDPIPGSVKYDSNFSEHRQLLSVPHFSLVCKHSVLCRILFVVFLG